MDYKYYKSHIYIYIHIYIYVTICILYSSWSRFQDPKSRVTRTTGHIQVSGNHWGYTRPVFIHVIRTFTTHTLHVRHMFGLPKFCRNFEPGCFFHLAQSCRSDTKKTWGDSEMALMKTPSNLLNNRGLGMRQEWRFWSGPMNGQYQNQAITPSKHASKYWSAAEADSSQRDNQYCRMLTIATICGRCSLIVSSLRRPNIVFSPDITPLGPTFVLNCCPVMVVQWRWRNHKKMGDSSCSSLIWFADVCRCVDNVGMGFNWCTSQKYQKWDGLLLEHHRIS